MTIRLIDCVSIDSKGDGFSIDPTANVELVRARAIGSGRHGFNIPVPGTNIALSQEDFEAAKEIIKTSPEAQWSDRISTLKSVLDLGAAAAQYVPVVVQFVRGLIT